MKIIIIGAGELGQLLATTLCAERHDVVVIDSSAEHFEHLKDKLDLMVLEGSCSDVSVLKNAGIAGADALLAVSGDEAANMIACQIATKFGVRKTICRFYSLECFSPEDGITPDFFGIWRAFSPPEECVRKISDILENPVCLEKIKFSNPDALMEVIAITPSSMLAGTRISDIAMSEMLRNIRFAAIVRGRSFLIPHGDTLLVPGDKVYIAGHREHVAAFVALVAPVEKKTLNRIVISGATDTGFMLARKLLEDHAGELRFIERSKKKGEALLDRLSSDVLVIQGDPTDEEVMEETGISGADLFVGTADDDEENILSCIMAKRLGAKKVVSLTRKPEYIRIVPAMDAIDSGLSSTLVSVNAVLRMLETGTMRIDAKLQRFHAHLTEFRISRKSPLIGRKLSECKLPSSAVFALLFRGADVVTPSGSTVFQENDTVVTIVTPESARELEPLFPGA